MLASLCNASSHLCSLVNNVLVCTFHINKILQPQTKKFAEVANSRNLILPVILGSFEAANESMQVRCGVILPRAIS